MTPEAEATTAISRIGQIAVPVEDVERATAFYRDVLGMRFLFQAPPGLAFFDCSGVRVMLDAPARETNGSGASIVYYTVPDLEATHASLVGKGVEFAAAPHLVARMPDHDLWMAFLRDSEGNVLGLMSEKRSG